MAGYWSMLIIKPVNLRDIPQLAQYALVKVDSLNGFEGQELDEGQLELGGVYSGYFIGDFEAFEPEDVYIDQKGLESLRHEVHDFALLDEPVGGVRG